MWTVNVQQLVSELRKKFLLPPLIWLGYKIRWFVYNRSLRLQLLLFVTLKYQLRLVNPDSRSEGFDDHFDMVVHVAAYKLASPEVFDVEANEFLFKGYPDSLLQKYRSMGLDYEKNKNEVDELFSLALKSSRIKSTLESYLLARNFTAADRKDEKAVKYYLTLAKTYNPNATAMDVKRIFEVNGETRKQLRDLKNQVSDREALKIAISFSNVGALASVVSTLFLITGYLYNNFLLGHFGIEVSKYFTLSDYLASSIEGVRYSASGAAIGLLFYFLGMHSASRKSYAQMELENKRCDYTPYLMLFITVAATLKFYWEDDELFFYLAYTSMLLVALIVSPWISRRYFKEPVIAAFSIVFVISFGANMYESVGKEIYRLEHKSIEELRRYDIFFRVNLPVDGSNVALIAANSNYLFLLDVNKKPYAVPREYVHYVTLHPKPNKPLQLTP